MRFIELLAAGLALLLITSCKRESLIIEEIDKTQIIGCYKSELAPPIYISASKIYFDNKLVSKEYEYSFDGRTTDKIISIRPRVYLQQDQSGYRFAKIPSLPDDYSAIFGFVADGEQWRRMQLSFLGNVIPLYTKVANEACTSVMYR